MTIKSTRIRGGAILKGNMAAIRQAFVVLLKGSIPRSVLRTKRVNNIIDLLLYYDIDVRLVPSYDNCETLFVPRVVLLESTEEKVRFKDRDFGNEWEVSTDLVLSTDLKEVGDTGHLVLKYDPETMRNLPKSDEMERQVGMKALQEIADPLVRLRAELPKILAEVEAEGEEAEEALFGPRAFTYLLEHMQTFFDEMKTVEPLLQSQNPQLGTRLNWIRTQLNNTLKDLKGESYAKDAVDRVPVGQNLEALQQHERLSGGVASQAPESLGTVSTPRLEHNPDGLKGDSEGDNP